MSRSVIFTSVGYSGVYSPGPTLVVSSFSDSVGTYPGLSNESWVPITSHSSSFVPWVLQSANTKKIGSSLVPSGPTLDDATVTGCKLTSKSALHGSEHILDPQRLNAHADKLQFLPSRTVWRNTSCPKAGHLGRLVIKFMATM